MMSTKFVTLILLSEKSLVNALATKEKNTNTQQLWHLAGEFYEFTAIHYHVYSSEMWLLDFSVLAFRT